MDEQKRNSFKLPVEWIDRIFKRFDEIWGARFLELFTSERDFDFERTRWTAGLYGATAEEIRKVLDMCRTGLIKDPPNVIEFYHYCKGHKQPLPATRTHHTISAPNRELGQKYLKLIQDKLHGRISDGDDPLSALNQQILDKQTDTLTHHWQND